MKSINLNEHESVKKTFDINDLKNIIFGQYKPVVIMASLIILALLVFIPINKHWKASENDAMTLYGRYQNIKAAEKNTDATNTEKVQTVIIPSDTAIDSDKLQSDMNKAEDYFETWFTWDDDESYDAARQNIGETFGEKSYMMTHVFTPNNKNHDRIATLESDMNYAKSKTYLVKINDDNSHTYLSLITVTTHRYGNTSEFPFLLSYDMNKDGLITNATIIMLSKGTEF